METCPRRSWISSNSLPEAWQKRAQVRRRIARRQLLQSNPFCRILHNVADSFLAHPFTQDPPHLRHSTESLSLDRSIIRAYDGLGLAYQALGAREDATHWFQRGIEEEQNFPERQSEWLPVDFASFQLPYGAQRPGKPATGSNACLQFQECRSIL
jgi:hypothetical protein